MNLPLGFAYSAVYAGIRQAQKDDLALIVSGLPANAAAVFTQNRVQAAPVKLCRKHLKLSKGLAGAVLINAGNANCATRTGDAVAAATAKAAAKALRLPAPQVLPASTGVIGVELDPRKITGALPQLVRRPASGPLRRRRQRHHDHRPRAQDRLRGSRRCAAAPCASPGMTKGSGMIHPQMATTLGFVMTDANIPGAAAARHAEAVASSAATTGSRWMATRRPTTPCCCWPTALPASGPIPRKCRWWKRPSPASWRGSRRRSRAMAKAPKS